MPTPTAKPILVTGAAGFIGFHVAKRLLDEGHQVVGVDNLNDYYDPTLKYARLDQLAGHKGFTFEKLDLADRAAVAQLFNSTPFDSVIHLAAQAGVRYSQEHPHAYTASNIEGTLNILEGCRHHPVRHLIYASSSSVYGGNTEVPFSETDRVDTPVSLYAATKLANELMAHTYTHLYGMKISGLRFFTVYGPWGRPDMAYFSFTKAILEGKPIRVFNHGDMQRDFTYIDDVVEGVVRLLDHPPEGHSLYNIGNHQPVALLDFIAMLEQLLGKEATRDLKPMQPGDVPSTYADTDALRAKVGFAPDTALEHGLRLFTDWYKEYYE